MTLIIRPASQKDHNAWGVLRHKLWPHESTEQLTDELNLLVPAGYFCLLALQNEKEIGFLEYRVRSHANGTNDSPILFIEGMYVDVMYRRQGIGQALIDALRRIASEKGIFYIGSDAHAENQASIECHRKAGFTAGVPIINFLMTLKTTQ